MDDTQLRSAIRRSHVEMAIFAIDYFGHVCEAGTFVDGLVILGSELSVFSQIRPEGKIAGLMRIEDLNVVQTKRYLPTLEVCE